MAADTPPLSITAGPTPRSAWLGDCDGVAPVLSVALGDGVAVTAAVSLAVAAAVPLPLPPREAARVPLAMAVPLAVMEADDDGSATSEPL
jgi:hypothetical protein